MNQLNPDPDVESTATQATGRVIEVPPGNYQVTVVLGDPEVAAATAVRAEARRMMLPEIVTAPGELVERVFNVNVRNPQGQPAKAQLRSPGLTLSFPGDAPRVHRVSVLPLESRHTVLFLAGDSTVCDQDSFPYAGWGQAIPRYLGPSVLVSNYSSSGEGSASFLAKPELFDSLSPHIRRDDLVLIQLAHNDKQTPAAEYRANLSLLINKVRIRAGRPVLVSAPVRRLFDETGQLTPVARHVNGLGVDLPEEMERVARETGVPYLNLMADSARLVTDLGPEAAKDLYLYREKQDNTHFCEYGADQMAQLVLARIRELDLLPGGFRNDWL